jgi:hypothetical protein
VPELCQIDRRWARVILRALIFLMSWLCEFCEESFRFSQNPTSMWRVIPGGMRHGASPTRARRFRRIALTAVGVRWTVAGLEYVVRALQLAIERESENGGSCCRRKIEKWGELLRPGSRNYASGTPAKRETPQIGKPSQRLEIEPHIDEDGNEGRYEHCDLGEAEPPENVFVAERTEPQ